jgi:hypothetical protein
MSFFLVVVKVIPNNLKANELLPYSLDLVSGLIAQNIKVVSYVCDGTDVERSMQRLMKESATIRFTYTIKHLLLGFSDLQIFIAVIEGQPVVMIQDSKHGLKTTRNNLFTSTKLFMLENHVAMYGYARDIAFGARSPLCKGNLTNLRRELHLSLAKGNPK